MIVRELVTKLGFNLDKAKLQQADKAFRKLHDKALGLNRALSRLGKPLAALGGIFGGVSLGVFANKLYDTTVEFERLSGALLTATGSQEKANEKFKELEKFASTTPYQIADSVDAFIKLKNLGLDPSIDSLKSFGNTSSALGKPLNQMIEAVADASTFEFERLKEFGIKARQQGNAVEFTFQGITTKVKKDSKSIQKYLVDIGKTKFDGAMAEQMKRLPGQISNLADTIDTFFRKIGESGFTKGFSKFVAALSGGVSSGEDLATVIGDKLGKGFEWLADRIPKIRDYLIQFWQNLDQVKRYAVLAAWAIGLIYAGKVIGGLFQVGKVVYYIVKGLKAVQIGAMLANAKILLIPALIVAAVAAIVGGIYYVYTRWEEFKAAFMGAAEAVIKPWWESFKALFDFLYNGFVETATIAYELLNPMTFMDAVGKIQKGVVYQKSGEALDRLLAAEKKRQAAGDPIFGFAGEFGKRFAPTFNQDMSALKEDIKKMIDFGGPNMEAMTGPMPAQAFAPAASAPLAPVSSNKTVNMKASINVKLSDGAVKKEIERGIIEAIQKLIRMTDPITGSTGN